MTLTVNPTEGESPRDRAAQLQAGFTKLRKLIVKQLKQPPEKRWNLQTKTREPDVERKVQYNSSKTPADPKPVIAWFGFLERTKRGEPHAHILLRAPFIPQDWISEQMKRLINAPIVWIEAISHLGKAIRYVTKYVGKAPAKFGNLKRYWQSHNWLTTHRERHVLEWKRGTYTVRRTCWRDLLQERVCDRWSWTQTEDGVWHFVRPEFSSGRYGLQRGPPSAARAQEEERQAAS